jgi:hypothetical protein
MKTKTPAEQAAPITRAHTRARGPDVFMAFVEVEKLPVAERRPELLRRLEALWETAMARAYVTKDGDERPNPDVASALRVVEVADAMLVEADGKQQRRAGLLELAMFKTERKAG